MIDYKKYFEKGISFQEYMQNIDKELISGVIHEYSQYVPMNFQRLKRIEKTLKLSEETLNTIKSLKTNHKWLLISEHWCGDASQLTSVFDAFAKASEGKIELKIVYRDENTDLIAAHLTNGGKSIPKLIHLNENYELISDWGPRPEPVQIYIQELKNQGIVFPQSVELIHKWYANDKTISTQKEICKLLSEY